MGCSGLLGGDTLASVKCAIRKGAIDFQGGWAFQPDSYYMYLVSNTLSQLAISFL